MSLLRVRNLSVSFTQDGATTRAVKNVSFEVGKGDGPGNWFHHWRNITELFRYRI